ncbi:MAG: RsmE family RNA methyltransferase [Thermoleophilia bacterium]|jgi:16S rRNA (uracil1498-N3)-methyltransferase
MKHIHRFFVSQSLTQDSSVCLDPDDSFHACRVLRIKPGDPLELADPDGIVFSARVTGTGRIVELMTESEIISKNPDTKPGLCVVQVLPAGKKMDLIVEKLSELGVDRLVPVFSDKSVARPAAGTGKLERWRRVARSAAGQSKRERVMLIDEPRSLRRWLDEKPGLFYVLSTEAEGMPLGQALKDSTIPVTLVIGPEAGFSDVELENFTGSGAVFVSLGTQVLRTETASVVAAALALHRLGALG